MKLIVGLGNPGEKYQSTRHNIGFLIVEDLARKLLSAKETKWKNEAKLSAETLKIIDREVILVLPQTSMNASGFAVAKIFKYYNLKTTNDLWVIHDDLDLPVGKLKIFKGHGSAGHHGVESIIKEIGSADFVRFRVGIGHPSKMGKWEKRHQVIDYVLEKFMGKDAVEASSAIEKAVKAVMVALEKGVDKAANIYNQ